MESEMTPRERVLCAISFEGPDRIPVHRYIFPGAFHRHGQKLVDFLNSLPDDFGVGPVTLPERPEAEGEIEYYTDDWGSKWRRLIGYTTGEVVEPVLSDWSKLPELQFPPLPSPEHFEAVRANIERTGHRYFTWGGGGSLFEQLQWIRGPHNLYMDLGEDRAELHELADRLVDYRVEAIRGYLAAGVDGCGFSDDWGAQDVLLISPRQWREFFKPRYKRMFDPILEAGKVVWFHSDGWTLEILEDLIELGVGVLNPQHHCMGNERVAQIIAGRVCLRSDLDRQYIIPFGTQEQIVEHVKEIIRLFGTYNGGLILHGEIGQDVPFENIVCMYEAFAEYGTYPLDWLD